MRRLKSRFWLILLAAFTLRLLPLRWHSFHPDEALYSWWAVQIARGEDPLLLSAWVDKPPLYLYILAASFRLFGTSEFSARFTGVFAGTISVALTWAWLKSLYGERVAAIGSILMAFLPFPVLFSPTALTDPWLSMLSTGSMWMACSGRKPSLTAFLAGFFAGLAVGTKQQGLLFIPLSLLLTYWRRREEKAPILSWLLGFSIPFALVEWWDALRWATRPSFWERSLVTYGGLRPVPWSELGLRFVKWLELLSWTAGGPVPAAILTFSPFLNRSLKVNRFDLALAGFAGGLFLLHWLLSFQTWDRYILPLAPFLAALWARGLAAPGGQRWKTIAVTAVLLFSLFALRPNGLPIGSNYSLYDGVESLALYLREHAGSSATIYHRYLGWHLHFYLGREEEVRWYPSPDELVKDLKVNGRGEKLLALTPFEDEEPLLRALEQAGYLPEKLAEFPRPRGGAFKVYRLRGREVPSY